MSDDLTCRSCRHSKYATVNSITPGKEFHGVLLCDKFRCVAEVRCLSFEYEPGTDEEVARHG